MLSLKSLIGFVAVVSVWLIGWSISARIQHQRVEQIRALGGEVEYKSLWPSWFEAKLGPDFTCRVQAVRFFKFAWHAGTDPHSPSLRYVAEKDIDKMLAVIAKLPHLEEVVVLSHNHGSVVPRLRASKRLVQIQLINVQGGVI